MMDAPAKPETAATTTDASPAGATSTTSSTRARKKARLRWARRAVVSLIALGVAAAVVVAWLPKPALVDVALAERGPMRVSVDEDGRTRVKDRFVVSAPIGGNVARIELRPGDAVDEHAVLARLVPLSAPLLDVRTRAELDARVSQALAAQMQARATIERARVAVQLAASSLERSRSLSARGALSASELERAELEARARDEELASARFGERVAAHQVEMARAAVGALSGRTNASEQLEVTSPISGQVLRVIQQSEGVVMAGAQLLELGDPAALEIVVDVLTSDAVSIRPGAHVEIERWGGEQTLHGRVRVVEPSAFTRVSALGVEEQRVNVVIDLQEPRSAWQSLGDGYRVEARILVWESADELRVPPSAVFRHGDGWAVFRIEQDRARLREVRVGRTNGLQTQIAGGLSPGDRIITHPSDQITDGARVEARR